MIPLKRIRPAVVIIPALMIGACFSARMPSPSDAREVFEDRISSSIDKGIVEIVSFEKTNGLERNFLGTEVYELEYEVSLRYPDGIALPCTEEEMPKQTESLQRQCRNLISSKKIDPKEPGETETIAGTLMFEKTEKGWRAENDNIY